MARMPIRRSFLAAAVVALAAAADGTSNTIMTGLDGVDQVHHQTVLSDILVSGYSGVSLMEDDGTYHPAALRATT